VLTAVPLLAFTAAANRIPLVLLGVLQYISPTLQFLCGVVVMGESMPATRWLGFALVWLGLAVFTVDSLWMPRREPLRVGAANTVR
jgi:chloramphenicol-sensitive protein RarD